MGICCSSCASNAEDVYEDNETNDKSNLLGNPVGENSRLPNYFSTNHGDRSGSIPSRIDEKAKLDRILQDTAKNYIDVPALNSPIDQPNYATVERHYSNKVKDILKDNRFVPVQSPLLSDVTQTEQMLSVEPMSQGDRKMVKDVYQQTITAMTGFAVNYTDSIIIPFDGYPNGQ